MKDELDSKSLFLEIVQMCQRSEAGRFAALASAALSGDSLLSGASSFVLFHLCLLFHHTLTWTDMKNTSRLPSSFSVHNDASFCS